MNLLREKLIIFIGVAGVSFSGIFAKIYDAPSIYIVLMRLTITSLIMLIPFIGAVKKEREVITPKLVIMSAVSGCVLAVHFFCFFEAVRLSSLASGTLLINTSVFFVPALMYIIFREKISGMAIIGIVITFAGAAIVAMGDSGGGNALIEGDVLAIIGAFCEAIYTVIGGRCRKVMSTTLYTGIVYWFTALTALIIVLSQGIPLTGYGINNYAAALGMAVCSTLLGHSIFSRGLKYLSPAFVSTSKLGEPVIAALLAIPLFGEIPALLTVIGGAVIIAGVAWTVKYQN